MQKTCLRALLWALKCFLLPASSEASLSLILHLKEEKGRSLNENPDLLDSKARLLTAILPTPSGDTQSTITYDLALDPGRPHSVAIFDETQNSTRRRVETLRLSQKCETLKLRLLVSRG